MGLNKHYRVTKQSISAKRVGPHSNARLTENQSTPEPVSTAMALSSQSNDTGSDHPSDVQHAENTVLQIMSKNQTYVCTHNLRSI